MDNDQAQQIIAAKYERQTYRDQASRTVHCVSSGTLVSESGIVLDSDYIGDSHLADTSVRSLLDFSSSCSDGQPQPSSRIASAYCVFLCLGLIDAGSTLYSSKNSRNCCLVKARHKLSTILLCCSTYRRVSGRACLSSRNISRSAIVGFTPPACSFARYASVFKECRRSLSIKDDSPETFPEKCADASSVFLPRCRITRVDLAARSRICDELFDDLLVLGSRVSSGGASVSCGSCRTAAWAE